MRNEIQGLNIYDIDQTCDFVIVPKFWENPELLEEVCIEAEERWHESDTAAPMCDYISKVLDDAGIDHDVYCRYTKDKE